MTPAEQQVDPLEFRAALSRFATGVCIVTALDARGRPVGLTVNSFSAVSLDPPLVLWSLRRSSPSFDVFSQCGRFAVSVLGQAQADLSRRFASPSVDRFAEVPTSQREGHPPVIRDALAQFICDTWHIQSGGDHIVLVGRVVHFAARDGAPLVFFGGRYENLREHTVSRSIEDLWPIPFW